MALTQPRAFGAFTGRRYGSFAGRAPIAVWDPLEGWAYVQTPEGRAYLQSAFEGREYVQTAFEGRAYVQPAREDGAYVQTTAAD